MERRRPRQFEGVEGGVIKEPVNAYLATCSPAVKRSLLMGVLTGATWTADRAHRRRLWGSARCPYCDDQGASEDEDHLLWHYAGWDTARGTPRHKISMMLSRIPSLPGDVKQWPACLRLCGLPLRDLLGSVSLQLIKLFVDTLSDMFSAVLMARMLVERREDAMFNRKL